MTNKVSNYRPIEALVPAEWHQSKVFANGIQQHVMRTGGDKPPLLLLHGFMESGASWLRLARTLAPHFDVVMPDARAHGRSDGWSSGFSPEILTEDAIRLIDVLNLDRPIVLGHSNGAVTSYLIAVKQPNLVRALVLEDPPAGGRPVLTASQDVLEGNNWYDEWMGWMRALKTMPHDERIQSTVARWPHGMPIPPDEPVWNEDDFMGRIGSLSNFDVAIFDTKIDFWSLLDYLDQASEIICPTLLLTGEPLLGSLVADDVVLTLMEQIPQLQWQQIEGASHILSRGRPFQATYVTIDAFLNSIIDQAD